jgi:hypothetical protein
MNAFIFGSAIELLTGLSGFLAFFAVATFSLSDTIDFVGEHSDDDRRADQGCSFASRIEPPTATQRARVPEPTVVRAERKPVITLKH